MHWEVQGNGYQVRIIEYQVQINEQCHLEGHEWYLQLLDSPDLDQVVVEVNELLDALSLEDLVLVSVGKSTKEVFAKFVLVVVDTWYVNDLSFDRSLDNLVFALAFRRLLHKFLVVFRLSKLQ